MEINWEQNMEIPEVVAPYIKHVDSYGLYDTMEPRNSLYVPGKSKAIEYVIPNKVKPAVGINEKIKREYRLKVYKGGLYVLSSITSYYQRIEGIEIRQFIDSVAHNEIRTVGNPNLYKQVEDLLLADYTLKQDKIGLLGSQVAFKNGILNLHTGAFYLNNGDYLIISYLNCDYVEGAICTVFDAFLQSVTGGDVTKMQLIWEVIGYILSTDMYAKSFFVFLGPKDTGKSLLADIIASFFLPDDISALNISDFYKKFDVSELEGKRINMCMLFTTESSAH